MEYERLIAQAMSLKDALAGTPQASYLGILLDTARQGVLEISLLQGAVNDARAIQERSRLLLAASELMEEEGS